MLEGTAKWPDRSYIELVEFNQHVRLTDENVGGSANASVRYMMSSLVISRICSYAGKVAVNRKNLGQSMFEHANPESKGMENAKRKRMAQPPRPMAT